MKGSWVGLEQRCCVRLTWQLQLKVHLLGCRGCYVYHFHERHAVFIYRGYTVVLTLTKAPVDDTKKCRG